MYHNQMPGQVAFDVLLGEKGCLIQKMRIKWCNIPWEKSMLSRWVIVTVGSPDERPYSFGNIDGAKSLD